MSKHFRKQFRRCRKRVFPRLPAPLKTIWTTAEKEFLIKRGFPAPGLLINESELWPLYRQTLLDLQMRVGAGNIGDYLEFGVCHGTSLRLMYDALIDTRLDHVRLFGFDSFAGLPLDEENEWKEGWYKADYNEVLRSLESSAIDMNRIILVKGFFRDTLTSDLAAKHSLRKVSLIMIDSDLYSSAKEALVFCAPFILDEAVIFFDDWEPRARLNKGEKRAFDEFLRENTEFEATATGEYSYWPGDLQGKVFRIVRSKT